jgi:hypothetical protein
MTNETTRSVDELSEKKSERLEVRLGYREKQDFVEACDVQGDTPSTAMRRFMRGYVRRADGDVLGAAVRRAAWRRGPVWVGAGAAVAGMAVLAMFALGPAPMSEDALFAARDQNADGALSSEELGLPNTPDGVPHGVMRVLDLDASGTISRGEFVREGRMVFTLSKTDSVLPEAEPRMTLVEFEFAEDEVRSGIFENAVVNSGDLDRLVVWYEDGTNTVMETDVEIQTGDDLIIMSDTVTVPSSMSVREEGDAVIASPNAPNTSAD